MIVLYIRIIPLHVVIKKHTHYFHMLSVKVVVYSIQSETQSK